jgi:putative ABC transport system ATP-binding protein
MDESMPRRNAGLALEVCGLRIVRTARGSQPRTVLDIAHLAIPAQAQAAVVGPAGAGKSLFLRALAALDRPERGSVWWGALDVAAMEPHIAARWRRDTLGIVADGVPLIAVLSAYQNVLLTPRIRGVPATPAMRQQARALLERVKIRENARAGTLATADLRRIEIVRALVHTPAIVLADEPTAGLSERDAANVLQALQLLAASVGATTVVATRDPTLASRLDRGYELAGLLLGREAPSTPPRHEAGGVKLTLRGGVRP